MDENISAAGLNLIPNLELCAQIAKRLLEDGEPSKEATSYGSNEERRYEQDCEFARKLSEGILLDLSDRRADDLGMRDACRAKQDAVVEKEDELVCGVAKEEDAKSSQDETSPSKTCDDEPHQAELILVEDEKALPESLSSLDSKTSERDDEEGESRFGEKAIKLEAVRFDDISDDSDDEYDHRRHRENCFRHNHDGNDNECESVFGDELDDNSGVYSSRLQELEEEQEQLNTSLIALTSHFAQVQLRLKQIVDADQDEKERLLKELEEFAFRGIPDLREPQIDLDEIKQIEFTASGDGQNSTPAEELNNKLELQRIKQKELICKLKDQLEDLEKYAYETGEMSAIPSSMLLERQSVIIEQLKGKLPLNLDEMDKLTPEDLRKHVDQAIRDIVNPAIMKEQLVDQLKTQVTDLERFIHFLQLAQDSKCTKGSNGRCTCSCPMHGNAQTGVEKYDPVMAEVRKKTAKEATKGRPTSYSDDEGPEGNREAIRIIRRVMTLLQMITFAQFGCNRDTNRNRFERNTLKKTTKGNHWGDLRARLELAVDHILEVDKEKFANDSDYTSDSDEPHYNSGNEKMTLTVRKELSIALRDLLEHGLVGYANNNSNQSLIVSSLFDWGCFSARSAQVATHNNKNMTAWDLFVRFYELKNGGIYRATAARRLSQSFNLHIVGGVAITPKQTLLTAIDEIIETHTPLKRSPDSHFKAFVCQALNEGKLVTWLRLIVKSRKLVENFYEPWSYVASTGFEDALRSLDKLSGVKFSLPTDLAIRQLKNISEAF